LCFVFQAEDGIRDLVRSRGLGDVYKGQALAIGLPLAWYVTAGWLEAFPFRITIGWWFFVLPAVLVLAIAWLTIFIKTIRTARLNPVKALRYE